MTSVRRSLAGSEADVPLLMKKDMKVNKIAWSQAGAGKIKLTLNDSDIVAVKKMCKAAVRTLPW